MEIVVAIFLLALLALLWQLWRWSILSTPSSPLILRTVEKALLDLGLSKKHTRIIDLGCGLGTTLVFFHRRGWEKLIGIEGFTPVWCLCLPWKIVGFGALRFLRGSYQKVNFSKSEEPLVFFAYISPKQMQQMRDWIAKEKPLFAWLVTHTFVLPGLKADYTFYAGDLYRSPVYVYSCAQILAQLKD
jgi:hypothetical protein